MANWVVPAFLQFILMDNEVASYSSGVEVDLGNGRKLLIVSGQISPKEHEGDFQAEVRLCMEKVQAVIEKRGGTMANVAFAACLISEQVKDFADASAKADAVYKMFFDDGKGPFPARAMIGVANLPASVRFEVLAIAVM